MATSFEVDRAPGFDDGFFERLEDFVRPIAEPGFGLVVDCDGEVVHGV